MSFMRLGAWSPLRSATPTAIEMSGKAYLAIPMMHPSAVSVPRPTGPASRTYTASPIRTPSTKKAMAESSCSRPDNASRTSPRRAEDRPVPEGGVSTAAPPRDEERPDDERDDERPFEGLVLAIT